LPKFCLKYSALLAFLFTFSLSCQQNKEADESLDSLNSQISAVEKNLEQLKLKRKEKMLAQGITYIEEEEILSNSVSDSTVILKGRVNTKLSNKIRISLDRPYRTDFVKNISVDPTGKFEKELNVRVPAIYTLKFGKLKSQVYLEPGQILGLVIDSTADQLFKYVGDLSDENNHLYSTQAFSKTIKCPSPKSKEEIASCLNTILDSSQVFAQEVSKNSFKDSYTYLLNNNHLYTSLLQFVNYLKKSDIKLDEIESQMDLDKISALNKSTSNLSLFSLYAYRKFIFEFFELSCQSIVRDSTLNAYDKYERKYKKADNMFKDAELNEFLKTDVVFESISKMKSSILNPLVLNLRQQIDNRYYLKTINDHYKKNIQAGIGTLAPHVEGPSYEGGKIKLSDYEGKYVYIFVWATWCGPCKMEIPYYEKLIADFSESNIEFVGVAVDKDESKWLQSFLFQKYPGTQVLVKGDWNSPIIKDFNLKSVPQFILINPKGEIVSLEAPRPSKGADSFLNTFGV